MLQLIEVAMFGGWFFTLLAFITLMVFGDGKISQTLVVFFLTASLMILTPMLYHIGSFDLAALVLAYYL